MSTEADNMVCVHHTPPVRIHIHSNVDPPPTHLYQPVRHPNPFQTPSNPHTQNPIPSTIRPDHARLSTPHNSQFFRAQIPAKPHRHPAGPHGPIRAITVRLPSHFSSRTAFGHPRRSGAAMRGLVIWCRRHGPMMCASVVPLGPSRPGLERWGAGRRVGGVGLRVGRT